MAKVAKRMPKTLYMLKKVLGLMNNDDFVKWAIPFNIRTPPPLLRYYLKPPLGYYLLRGTPLDLDKVATPPPPSGIFVNLVSELANLFRRFQHIIYWGKFIRERLKDRFALSLYLNISIYI